MFRYFASVILLLSFVYLRSFADLRDGLIGYWKFDEGSGGKVKDISGKDHHGKLVSGEIKWINGKEKKAIYFSGTDIQIDDHPDFHLEDAVSVSLWTKPDGAQSAWAKFLLSKRLENIPTRCNTMTDKLFLLLFMPQHDLIPTRNYQLSRNGRIFVSLIVAKLRL